MNYYPVLCRTMKKKDLIYEYETYWKDILETDDGKIIKPKLYKVLYQYNDLLENLTLCYSLMSNGRINDPYSKIENVKLFFEREFIKKDEVNKEERELEDE